MKLLSLTSLFLVSVVISVKETTAGTLRSSHRPPQTPKSAAKSLDNAKVNGTRPRGVFLFDDNCLWYLHGKGQLVAKINCVSAKKQPPVIVAQRRNGQMHYKLHHGSRPWRHAEKKNSSHRRGSKRKQIPLKCYYRYDEKGVFYLTSCYTHSNQFGPVELNFHGHRPGEKTQHRGASKHHRKGAGKHWRKRGKHAKGGRRHGRRNGRRSRHRRRKRMFRRQLMKNLRNKRRLKHHGRKRDPLFRLKWSRYFGGGKKSKGHRKKNHHKNKKHSKSKSKKKQSKRKKKKKMPEDDEDEEKKKSHKKRTTVKVKSV